MNDAQLIEISRGVDNYISTLLMKYETLTPLSIAAVLLARAMVLNNEAGSSDDFVKLLQGVAENPPQRNETKVH
jgi:hypothetical protein